MVEEIDPSFLAARVFTLQWHITQACDLHCRHCYDRDQYTSLALEQGIAILDDFSSFCNDHHVHGQVTFTGGNPLLHPDFEELYQEAACRGFTIGILGNPTTRDQLQRLIDIQPPSFYQVSLEGLAEHNDYIRGEGHYQRVMEFLDLLRDMHIYSMVMLTLTSDNMNQVLELAEILKCRTDRFTFNRLSQVGEGANLSSADAAGYADFLRTYIEAADTNPCMTLKDNLINITCNNTKRPLFGGCTGHGCGAAFNFLSVLADGSVHACRKFPSPLGSLIDKSLHDIYHSSLAESYRSGPEECTGCTLRAVCRGCLAIAHSHGLDIFTQKDPYCFMEQQEK
jgi:selenobiotic family peptide radical SAM maturase